jgi:O-antigen ligase
MNGRSPVRRQKTPLGVKYTYLLWFDVLMDPHRWLAEVLHIGPLQQMQTILLLPFMVLTMLRMPAYLRNRNRTIWFLPFLILLTVAIITVPFATNIGVAKDQDKSLVVFYVMAVGTFMFIDTPRRVLPIVAMYVGQYLWWNAHAGTGGGVWWHPQNYNQDSFGPLDLMGVPVAFFFGMAMRPGRMRTFLMYILAPWCLFGVIAAIARGTVLAMVPMVGLMWWRYPNKKQASLAMVGGFVLLVAMSSILFPGGAFWTEMKSSFTEGKSEGTGNDRWELWMASLKVWEENPLFGAGTNNFGPEAARIIEPGEIGADYKYNPKTLYERQLHNIYFQLLSELGLVGVACLIALLIDFWRKNLACQRADHRAYWRTATGGKYDLHWLAVGLECSMVGYLFSGLFYNQLYNPWLFTLLALNVLLFDHSRPLRQNAARRAGRGQNVPRAASDPAPVMGTPEGESLSWG